PPLEGDDSREASTSRRHHLESYPRALRRTETPVPLPLHRLSEPGEGSRHPPRESAWSRGAVRRGNRWIRPARARGGRFRETAGNLGDPGLGVRPDGTRHHKVGSGHRGADPWPRREGRAGSADHAGWSARYPDGISVRPENRSDPSFVPRLAGFIAFLRVRGFAVGIGSALDCAHALRQISILDRDTFLAACIVTLAKSPEDVPRLIESFDLYWSTYIEPADSKTRLAVSAPPSPPPDGVDSTSENAPGFRIAVDRGGAVRIGLYSPDAPSSGHNLRLLYPKPVSATPYGTPRGCSRSARNSTRFQASCGGGVTSTRPGRPLDTSDPWEEELGSDAAWRISSDDTGGSCTKGRPSSS